MLSEDMGQKSEMSTTAPAPIGPVEAGGSGNGTAPERLSAVLRRLASRQVEKLTLGDISRALKDRGFGALMILLSAPNLIIMPPGVSTIFGLPMMFVAFQLVYGYRKPLLPTAVRYREVPIATFRSIIDRIEPWILRFERVARPRWWILPQRIAEQVVGGVSLLMGLILILPIPFGNFLPAVAIILMCLGLGERDGVWTGTGILVAILSVGIVIGVVATAGLAFLNYL
jgi:hypothetical protein